MLCTYLSRGYAAVLHSEQVALGNRLLKYIETKTTALGKAIYAQPISEYVCKQQAEIEKQVFFRNQLLCVGLSARLPSAGSFITDSLSGIPILLTRDAQNTVHGFLNVCRHRGAQIARGCGTVKSFSCPYHAWRYDLLGKLISRPQDDAFSEMPRENHGLIPLPVIERDGMLWVCPSPGQSTDINKKLGGISNELASYNLASFHHFDSCTMRRRMNWKLIVDTFLESYHFGVLHKDTIWPIFYDNLSTFDAWGPNFRLVSARRTIDDLKSLDESEWSVLEHIVGIYVLFPNTVLVWQLDHVELWHIYPGTDDPNLSVVRLDLYTPEPTVTEKMKKHWKKNLDLVVKVVEEEDFPVGETIQTGFHSLAQSHITFGTNEPALTHFHRSVTHAIQAGRKTT